MADNPLSIKDTLLGDLAKHQRITGQEVTPSANDALVVPVFEEIERMEADPPPAPKQMEGDEKPRHEGANARSEERMENTGRPVPRMVEVPAEPLNVVVLSEIEGEFFERLNRRIDLLLSKVETGALGEASWHERVMSIVGMKAEPTIKNDRRLELLKLAEESNEIFGDWKKDPEKKLHFHAKN